MSEQEIIQSAPVSSGPVSSGRQRGLLIGLVASVALNLVIGGFIIGRLNHPADMVKTGMMAGLVKVAQKLPEQDRTLLRTALHDAKPRFKEAMQHRREAQNEIKQALLAEPFDVQKLAGAMNKARQITDQGRDNFHDMVLDLAPKFSPEGRKALANIRRDREGDQHRMMDMIESKIDTPPSP